MRRYHETANHLQLERGEIYRDLVSPRNFVQHDHSHCPYIAPSGVQLSKNPNSSLISNIFSNGDAFSTRLKHADHAGPSKQEKTTTFSGRQWWSDSWVGEQTLPPG